jgi:hypothetical protein
MNEEKRMEFPKIFRWFGSGRILIPIHYADIETDTIIKKPGALLPGL